MITKEILKNYLKDQFDVTLGQIYEDLHLEPKDLQRLELFLEQLVEEKWIKKSSTLDGYEYDPGEKLDFGGIEG